MRLVFASAFAPLAAAATCSAACSAEFINSCMPFNNQGYDACRTELDAGTGPLATKCVPGCSDTTDMAAAKSGATPAPTPATGGGGGGGTGLCSNVINGNPTTPTLCGWSSSAFLVYTLWPHTGTSLASTQRYFSVANLPSSGPPQPVVIQASGYGGDASVAPNADGRTAAAYYRFTHLQI